MSSKINWIATLSAFAGGFLLACTLLNFAVLEGRFEWLQELREWISAFSGWAAAAAALLVGAPTLRFMRDQLKAPIIAGQLRSAEKLLGALPNIIEWLVKEEKRLDCSELRSFENPLDFQNHLYRKLGAELNSLSSRQRSTLLAGLRIEHELVALATKLRFHPFLVHGFGNSSAYDVAAELLPRIIGNARMLKQSIHKEVSDYTIWQHNHLLED